MGLAAISFSLTYMLAWLPERNLQIYQLKASNDFVTIPVEEGRGGEYFLYIYNLKDKSLAKVISKTSRVYDAGPGLKDSNKIYVAAHNKQTDPKTQNSTLWQCGFKEKTCGKIFSQNGIVGIPKELSNGKLLYIRSPARLRVGHFNSKVKRIRFTYKDFYIFDTASGIKKITDFELYSLSHLSVAENKLIFQAYGPAKSLGYEIGGKRNSVSEPRSSIFSLNLDISNNNFALSGSLKQPFVQFGSRVDTYPSAIAHPTVLAFTSADSGISVPGKKKSGWAYEIIVYNYETKKILHQIHPARRDLSNPALMPSGMLYYTDSDSDGLDLYAFNIKSGAKKRLLSKKWNRLSSQAKAIQLD